MARRAETRFANDNHEANATGKRSHSDDRLLQAALRHFAEHGLGAARAARAQADAAFLVGDQQGYDWWLSITRTLDRRLAAQAERRTQGKLILAAPGKACARTLDLASSEIDDAGQPAKSEPEPT
ncbi:MAG: hypothetical protein AAFR88_02100 [Pseudomonadota bacterium]